MSIAIDAMVVYGDAMFGTFDIGKMHGEWSKARERFPMRGLPEEMPPTAWSHLAVSVEDKFLPDSEIQHRYILRREAERDVQEGLARWLDNSQDEILYFPAFIPGYSWIDLNEMPDFLACIDDEFLLPRLSAIYALMKVLAEQAKPETTRFIYWLT